MAASDTHLTPNVVLDSIHKLLAATQGLCSLTVIITFLPSFLLSVDINMWTCPYLLLLLFLLYFY
jgi:hypothetical protein